MVKNNPVKLPKNVLTVGAYDRDNFGDILFYLITKKYLSRHTLVPAGVVAADMQYYMQDVTLPYPLLKDAYDWDLVWVVGGEVGGVINIDANRMLMDKEFESIYLQANQAIRDKISKIFGYDPDLGTTAYIPKPVNHTKKKKMYILNSSGLASLESIPDHIRTSTNAALKDYDYVYVRDKESKRYCDENGIGARLSPDLVHTLKLFYGDFTPSKTLPKKYFVMQFTSLSSIKKTKKYMANLVDKIINKLDMDVVFLAAGTANHHDSMSDYEDIVNKMVNRNRARVFYDRKPEQVAGCIALSSLAIGTSLHVRVVAITYAVPRISLKGTKLTAYAASWDSQQPYDVDFGNTTNSIDDALGASRETLIDVARRLEEDAHQSMKELMELTIL